MAAEYERRTIALPDDLRAEGPVDAGTRRIVGHAAVFDAWTTLYESREFTWREVVRPGAFRGAIIEKQDVRALWNHDPNFILGRTASDTLHLEEDVIGLRIDIDPPDTQTVRDLVLTPIARGDVTQMSFAFRVRPGGEKIVRRAEGGRTIEERELTDLDLSDVSPVAYPAYQSTDVALRGQGERHEREILASLRSGRHDRVRVFMRMRMRLVEAR